jgi:hypothetical protein
MNEASYTPEQVIRQALHLREMKKAMEQRHAEEKLPLDQGLEACENFLLAVMIERKEKQIKTEDGTAYQAPQMRVRLVDRAAFVDYVRETGNFDMFTSAVSKEAVRDYMDKNPQAPPGVEVSQFTACNIRKA